MLYKCCWFSLTDTDNINVYHLNACSFCFLYCMFFCFLFFFFIISIISFVLIISLVISVTLYQLHVLFGFFSNPPNNVNFENMGRDLRERTCLTMVGIPSVFTWRFSQGENRKI